jgi:hypothetical protein
MPGGDIGAFKRDLRSLRAAVGSPRDSWFRREPHPIPRSTLFDLLNGPSKPRLATVEFFLVACETYALSDEGRAPADEEAFLRSIWSDRYHRLPGTPAPVIRRVETEIPSEDRRWVGVVPQPAGRYQDRGLAETFDAPGPRQHVLTGLGGVGKTQVAARLARRLWEAGEIDDLFWVQAGTRGRVISAYRLGAPGSNVPGDDDEQAVSRFLSWLETTERRWLVVLDDLADPAALSGLWPPVTRNGRTVITTRRTDASLAFDEREIVQVRPFTPAEALTYLHAKLSDRPDLAVGAEELVAEMAGHPLALSQAVVYLLDVDLTCSQFLGRLRRLRLHDLVPETLPDNQSAAVAATLELSLRHADELRPVGLATPVLRVAALLDPDGIPENLFATVAVTAAVGSTAVDIRDALRCLRRVSLIDIDQVDHGRIRVHSLVQRVTREGIPRDELLVLRRAAADALLEIWSGAGNDPEQRARLHANATAVATADLYVGGVHPLVFEAGRSMAFSGGVEAAIDHFARAREAAAAQLGAEHVDVLNLRLAEMYWLGTAEYYDVAAKLAASLVDDSERLLGSRHQVVVDARIYHARWLGHEDPAVAIARLPGIIAELGPGHPETLTARNDLAYFRGASGDHAGAAEDFRLLAEERALTLGRLAEHTLISRNGHGFQLGEAGLLDQAIDVLAGVHADCAERLGPRHLHTLASLGNLLLFLGRRDGTSNYAARLRWLHGRLREQHGERNRQTTKFEEIVRNWQQSGAD